MGPIDYSGASYETAAAVAVAEGEEVSVSTHALGDERQVRVEDKSIAVALKVIHEKHGPKKRRRISYDSNVSGARGSGLVESENPYIDPLSTHAAGLDLRDRLEDHASRRIQLFYYLALAYHNSGCTVQLGKTSLQHGVGKAKGTSGAHSCILPNINDNYFQVLKTKLIQKGPSPSEEKRLLALGCDEDRIHAIRKKKGRAKEINKLFEGIDTNQLFTIECPFYHAMNATVQLPSEMAHYDDALEGVMRPVALELINQCARGVLDPYIAAQHFERDLKHFYQSSYEEFREKNRILIDIDRIERELYALELKYFSADITDPHDYFKTYLKIASEYQQVQKRIRALHFYSINLGTHHRLPEHHALFKLTKAYCSDESHTIRGLSSRRDAWHYIQDLQRRFAHVKDNKLCPVHVFKGLRLQSPLNKLKGAALKFWESTDSVELYLAANPVHSNQVAKFLKHLEEMEKWRPSGVLEENASVEKMIHCLRLQRTASALPSKKQLSGRCVSGTLQVLNNSELDEQRNLLIQRRYDVTYTK